jgi:hypothetical protein
VEISEIKRSLVYNIFGVGQNFNLKRIKEGKRKEGKEGSLEEEQRGL